MNNCPRCNARLPRRLQFLPPTYGARPVTGVIAFTAVYGAVLFAAFHKYWPPDLWPWPPPSDTFMLAGGALLFGSGLALEGVAVTTLFWWLEQTGDTQRVEASVPPGFSAVGPRTLRRLPDGVDEHTLWRYLVDVARKRVTLSQEGAAEHGLTQDESNGVKDWLVAVGWWQWINRDNATGRWTGEGERVLELLARPVPALWDEIINGPTAADGTR